MRAVNKSPVQGNASWAVETHDLTLDTPDSDTVRVPLLNVSGTRPTLWVTITRRECCAMLDAMDAHQDSVRRRLASAGRNA